MTRKLFFLFLILALLLAGCAPKTPASPAPDSAPEALPSPTAVPPTPVPTAAPQTMTDDMGNEISLAARPQKIISLAPSITESLFAIGAGSQVIGREDTVVYPPEAMELPSVGSLWNGLPLEAILAMEPDLVLVAEITSAEDVKAMQDAGLTVFWQKNPSNLDELYANLRTLAQLTGHEDEAETLVASLQERVDAVDAALEGVEDAPLVFYELDATDPSNPYTAGPGTFIDLLIARAGGRNVGASLEGEWAQINVEALLEQDPDMILLADALYGTTPESVAARAGWDALRAVQNGKVYPFDPYLLSVPGPRLIDGLETLAVFLHPEIFCASLENIPADVNNLVCTP